MQAKKMHVKHKVNKRKKRHLGAKYIKSIVVVIFVTTMLYSLYNYAQEHKTSSKDVEKQMLQIYSKYDQMLSEEDKAAIHMLKSKKAQ